MNNTTSFYKEEAKSKMMDRYGEVILFLIIITLISVGLTALTDNFRPVIQEGIIVDSGIPALVTLFSAISFLFSAGIAYSSASLYIDISNNESFELMDKLKSGFTNEYGRNIVLVFLHSLFLVLWAFLFIIPAFIKAYSYAMSMYIGVKEPKITGLDAITKSRQLMNGNKTSLFVLDLSYIGWYLLSILTFGILLLWVVPKHQTARTLFFNEIYIGNNPVQVDTKEKDIFDTELL